MTDTEMLAALVEHLVEAGALRSERWRHAFQHVPRHAFIPRLFLDRYSDGRFIPLDGNRPDHRSEWLAAVYSDDTLITQIDGDDQAWKTVMAEGSVRGLPTSSSSQPSLMAMMLEALDVENGQRVLEIGTGTGYNAALMCEALGSGHVASVDIDAGLVESAKERLAGLGYTPALAVADGADGFADGAPYDRIMATCSLPGIPSAWIAQTRPGGRILVNLDRPLGGGALVLLAATDKAHATGRFLPFHGGFMPTRSYATPSALDLFKATDQRDGATRETGITIDVLDGPFSMFAALRVLARRLGVLPGDGPEQGWLLAPDGSWACQTVTPDHVPVVTQAGPVKLWDLFEAAHAEWCALGQPPREAFGLTVMRGRQCMWFESPGSGHVWEMST
jgi:methyltransferase of ATP-grasp peptide maturase system